jgi:hypothetical protein
LFKIAAKVGVAPGTTTGSLAKALATVGGLVVVVVLVDVVVVGFVVVVVVGLVVVVVDVVVVPAFGVSTFGIDVDVATPW